MATETEKARELNEFLGRLQKLPEGELVPLDYIALALADQRDELRAACAAAEKLIGDILEVNITVTESAELMMLVQGKLIAALQKARPEDAQESDGYLSPEEITEKATAFLERYSPEETAKHMARWAEARYRLRYSDEERQVVELVRLAKELLRRDQAADTMDIALRIKDYSLVSVMRPGFLVGSLDYAITELQRRLAPKPPQRPTQEEYAEFIEKLLQPSFGGRLPNWHRRIAESFSERKHAADKHDAAGGEQHDRIR